MMVLLINASFLINAILASLWVYYCGMEVKESNSGSLKILTSFLILISIILVAFTYYSASIRDIGPFSLVKGIFLPA